MKPRGRGIFAPGTNMPVHRTDPSSDGQGRTAVLTSAQGRRCEGLVRGIAKPNDNVRCLAGTPWHEGPLAVWGGVGLVKLFYAPETARGTCALMGPGTGRGVPKVLADRQYRSRR